MSDKVTWPEPEGQEQQTVSSDVDSKIVHNGTLVEELFRSIAWQEIVGPELYRLINSAGSSQKEDGTWIQGQCLTRLANTEVRTWDAGYQSALMEFSNNLLSFVKAKEKVVNNKRKEIEKDRDSSLEYPMREE